MTTIDGTETRWRTWLPGVAHLPALELATARGCTIPQLLASLVAEAHDSTAADLPSAGAVDGGQGATRPPAAPTISPITYTESSGATITTPVPHVHHIPELPCGFGDRCGR